MNEPTKYDETVRFSHCIDTTDRVRWDIDADVIRGRNFDFSAKFLPDRLSRVHEIDFLSATEQRLMSQIQGRTYANMIALLEGFINDKVREISFRNESDSVAIKSLLQGFSEDEMKHQRLFRRVEAMIDYGMPTGYRFVPRANELTSIILSKSNWSVLAFNCHTELFTQAHYKQSTLCGDELSALYKDIFLYHWREESQHAIIDEIEWLREDVKLNAFERDCAVDDLIALFIALDGILQVQSESDVEYFTKIANRGIGAARRERLLSATLAAYRWQYIALGLRVPRFADVFTSLISPEQFRRFHGALRPLTERIFLH